MLHGWRLHSEGLARSWEDASEIMSLPIRDLNGHTPRTVAGRKDSLLVQIKGIQTADITTQGTFPGHSPVGGAVANQGNWRRA